MDYTGAIDCDMHPRVPGIAALSRYMSDYWRETVEVRGIEGFDTIAYPANAPLSLRPDYKQGQQHAESHLHCSGAEG